MKKQNEPWILRVLGGQEYADAKAHLRRLHSQPMDEQTAREIAKTKKWIKHCRRKARQKAKLILMGITALLVLLIIIGICRFFAGRSAAKKLAQQQEAQKIEEQKKAEQEAKTTDLVLSFTGDCILGTDENFDYDTSWNSYYENYGSDYFLKNVKKTFEGDDLTVVNFEGTLTKETDREDKQYAFKGDPDFVKALSGSSVEAANVANNHTHDYGEKSFTDTVDTLKSNGITPFGYDDVAVIDVKGVKVGLFGIYELDDHLERKAQVISNIKKCKDQGAEIIVAEFHWGNELETVPDENQVTLAHLAIDEGANLVVGHHPHVLQGIEEYKGCTIAYSLGNFCFGGNTDPTEYETAILQMKFTVNGLKKVVSSEKTVIPCLVSSETGYNDYQPTIATGDEANRILQIIKERSDAIADDTSSQDASSKDTSSQNASSKDKKSQDKKSQDTSAQDESEQDTVTQDESDEYDSGYYDSGEYDSEEYDNGQDMSGQDDGGYDSDEIQ